MLIVILVYVDKLRLVCTICKHTSHTLHIWLLWCDVDTSRKNTALVKHAMRYVCTWLTESVVNSLKKVTFSSDD